MDSSYLKCVSPSQAPVPDTYRGVYREDHPDPGQAYADTVKDLIEEVHGKGRKVTQLHAASIESETLKMYIDIICNYSSTFSP